MNGVEIDFNMISIEVTSNWDNSINNISANNNFEFTFIDATNNRSSNVRSGFSYFRGVDSSGSPFSFPFSQRRRVVIIDNTNPAAPEILYNEIPERDSLSANDVANLFNAINSVEAAPVGLDFATWQGDFTFPDGLSGPNDDPDGDGTENLLEFVAGTDPLNSTFSSPGELIRTEEGLAFRYQMATDRIGVTHRLQNAGLENFTDFTPDSPQIIALSETVNQITITLAPGVRGFFRQVVSLQP